MFGTGEAIFTFRIASDRFQVHLLCWHVGTYLHYYQSISLYICSFNSIGADTYMVKHSISITASARCVNVIFSRWLVEGFAAKEQKTTYSSKTELILLILSVCILYHVSTSSWNGLVVEHSDDNLVGPGWNLCEDYFKNIIVASSGAFTKDFN